jgi:lysophospholipase L1-like esterase
MLLRVSHAVRIGVLASVLAWLAIIPATGSSLAHASLVGPKAYYLALGDSLAYGVQPNLDNDAGYPADFFTNLQSHGTSTLADMGCSGETTVSFVNGGCPYRNIFPPHYKYSGPQLAAALAFLQQHPGQVSPVTIDIGANDLLNVIDPSTCTFSALTTTVQLALNNLQSILSQLQAALHGSGDLITMTYYFPYQNTCPNLVPYAEYFNSLIAAVARQNGALVAPVFAAYGGAAVPNPYLCTLTWICQTTSYPTCKLADQLCIHPTTLGYKVIADAMEATAGY